MTRKIPDIGVSSVVISMMINDAAIASRYRDVIITAVVDVLLLVLLRFIINSDSHLIQFAVRESTIFNLQVLSIIIRNDSSVQLIICSKRRKRSIVDNWQPCIFPESPATVDV